jgi:hypothetical protein
VPFRPAANRLHLQDRRSHREADLVSWQRIDLADPQYDRPTEPPAICGLIYQGKRHALSGPPEAAKTLAALIFGLEQMRAGKGTFALIDFEMGEHATRLLLHDLGATLEEIGRVYYTYPSGPPEQADLDAITAAGVTLAIVDAAAGAYNASGLDDNKRADAETFSRAWITPLWQRNITTIILDHVVKNSDARGRYAIGSERKLGTVDVHLGLEAVKQLHRGTNGLVRITTHKDRPGHLPRPRAAELELHSDPDTHRITWTFNPVSEGNADDGDRWRPTFLMDSVLDFLSRNPEPISRSALANAVKGRREYVLQAIDCLVEDGHLHQDGRKLVPVPGTYPERVGTTEGNGNVPRSLSTEGNDFGNDFGNADKAAA